MKYHMNVVFPPDTWMDDWESYCDLIIDRMKSSLGNESPDTGELKTICWEPEFFDHHYRQYLILHSPTRRDKKSTLAQINILYRGNGDFEVDALTEPKVNGSIYGLVQEAKDGVEREWVE